ncbi:hypothetical protein [Endozoicomonas euniceicola]|uniref:Class I SAM-dependent methyltransferase n=1 Tax=Endozoicomonas euniceicola TaxID=1234143 RepID=A0ABY6GWH7_9GAMM|nr:hypothetical protein [Endozoicomonas euniceicola]UYM17121.1 hypothetical protein NX720_04140 [Endozoicomonas euniceicola]
MITPPLSQNRPMTDIADVLKPAPLSVWAGRVIKVATETVCEVTAQNPLAGSEQTPLQVSKTVAEKTENEDLPVKNEQLLCQAISGQAPPDDFKSQMSRHIDFYTSDSMVPYAIEEKRISKFFGEMPFYVARHPGCLSYTYGAIKAKKFKILMEALNECREKFPDNIISVGSGSALAESTFGMIPGKKVHCFDAEPTKLYSMNINQASIPEDMDTILPEDCSKTMLMLNYPRGYIGETLKEFANRGGKAVFMTLDNSLQWQHFKFEPDGGKTAIAEIHKLLQEKKSTDFVIELSDGNYTEQVFAENKYVVRKGPTKVVYFNRPENDENFEFALKLAREAGIYPQRLVENKCVHNYGPTYAVCFNGPENFQSALERASERAGIPMEVETYASVPWNTLNELQTFVPWNTPIESQTFNSPWL